MITLKLSPFKKILMSLLVAMLNATYHINVSAYSILTTTAITGCKSYCISKKYATGHRLNCLEEINVELPASMASYYANSNGKCLCLNSMELQALDNCGNPGPCSTYGVSAAATGLRFHVLNSQNSFNCNAGYGDCFCKTGYYAKNQSCVICPTGYKCTGGQMASVGLSTTTGSTVCPMGYYQSRTGQSTCTACSLGYYQSRTGQSTCTACASGHYAASSATAYSCDLCSYEYYQSMTGQSTCTKCPSLDSIQGFSDRGANNITRCYLPSDYTFTENDTGHKYEFTSNCYYAS